MSGSLQSNLLKCTRMFLCGYGADSFSPLRVIKLIKLFVWVETLNMPKELTRIYYSNMINFELRHPKEWIIRKVKGGGGGGGGLGNS